MKPNPKEKTRVQFDLHHCQLSEAELDTLRTSLDSLMRQVENFPIADVHVLIEYNGRSNDYSVKVTLVLPGETLVGNDHDPAVHNALDRCLMGLEENIRAYKDRLGQVPARQKQEKGTYQDLEPTPPPDPEAMEKAVREGDYAAFRRATFGFEEPMRKRVGRWVERYPDVQARIGKGLEVGDVVEDVFLSAFEGYDGRPPGVRFSEWLVSLIDPAVKELQKHGEAELENINLVRTARDAQGG